MQAVGVIAAYSFDEVRERPHRIAAVPADRGVADQVEHLALRPCDLGQFDHGAGMILGVEIDEAPALADLAAHAELEALRAASRSMSASKFCVQ